MKRIYLLITLILSLTLSVSSVSASNGTEIIPFHPDPSLVTEWDVGVDGDDLSGVTFDTLILKVIIPDGMYDVSLFIDGLKSSTLGKSILWIYPAHHNSPINLEISYYDSFISTIWLGGGQSRIPNMRIGDLYIRDGFHELEDIYIYPDVFIYDPSNIVNIKGYNFEYELSQEYQLGYNDGYDEGWGEKNRMTDITFLIIGLIIFIIANILGFIYKINLLTALSGLLWLLPIFLVDNIFIKIFSVIIMLITFIFSFKERSDYYV